MEIVLRALLVYAFLLIIFRINGKRSLGEATPIDLVLLLIIAESLGTALSGDDMSLTGALLVVICLATFDIALSLLKQRSEWLERLFEGMPLTIVRDGKPVTEHMNRERIDEEDILQAARETQGIERIDDIGRAVLERDGAISIIPREGRDG